MLDQGENVSGELTVLKSWDGVRAPRNAGLELKQWRFFLPPWASESSTRLIGGGPAVPSPVISAREAQRAGLRKEGWLSVNAVERVKQWVRPGFFLSMCCDKRKLQHFSLFFLFIE